MKNTEKKFNRHFRLPLSYEEKASLMKAVISDDHVWDSDVSYEVRKILYIRDYTYSILTMPEQQKEAATLVFNREISPYVDLKLLRESCLSIVAGVDARYVDVRENLTDDDDPGGFLTMVHLLFMQNKEEAHGFIRQMRGLVPALLSCGLYDAAVNAVNVLREIERAYSEIWRNRMDRD